MSCASWGCRGGPRVPAAGPRPRPRGGLCALLPIAAVASLAIGSAWLQRAAYKELRGSKLTYLRMVDFVGHETAAGRAVVTDLWWLDQAAASLADSRRFFVVD